MENRKSKIKSINLPEVVLEDGSIMKFSLIQPHSWRVGHPVGVSYRDTLNTRMKSQSMCVVKNLSTKQELPAIEIKGPIQKNQSAEVDRSASEYTNLDVKLTIRNIFESVLMLEDDSGWQLSAISTRFPGEWEEGDTVIVTRGVAKSISKIYQIKNLDRGTELLAVFLGYEE